MPSVRMVKVVAVVDKEELNRPLFVRAVRDGNDDVAGVDGIKEDIDVDLRAAKHPVVIFKGNLCEIDDLNVDFKAKDLIDLLLVIKFIRKNLLKLFRNIISMRL